ncbi:MAG: O-antigen ligase family protein [Akkermansia sp.]
MNHRRISQTWIGKAIILLLFLVYSLVLTSATGGKWYDFYLPSVASIIAIGLFALAIILKTKLPQMNRIAWCSILLGGGYFLIRAWYSDGFYKSLADIIPILFAIIFYILGTHIALQNGKNKILFSILALFIIANFVCLLFPHTLSPGRPNQLLTWQHVSNTGLFGYKNFAGQFLVGTGVFCIGYFILSGIRSWYWLLLGLWAWYLSFDVHSRAVYPNISIGICVCWLLVLIKSYKKTKIFIVLSIGSLIAFCCLVGVVISLAILHPDTLSDLSTYFQSSGRFSLSSLALVLAEQSPIFGLGAQSFTQYALPFSIGEVLPNMAHNEYAQVICDYGITGLILMIGIIASHLYLGFKTLLRQQQFSSKDKALHAGALALVIVICIHASFDFVWHNAALLSITAFCMGILVVDKTRGIKVGSPLNNYGQLILALGIATILGLTAQQSYPIWKLSWEMNSLPIITDKTPPTREHLRILTQAVERSHDPDLTEMLASVLIPLNASRADKEQIYPQLIKHLEQAISLDPNNDILKTLLGQTWDRMGQFEKGDALLFPYSIPNLYYGYPWKMIYANHLLMWAEASCHKNPAQALSLFIETIDYTTKQPYSQQREDIKNKATIFLEILQRKEITPDDTWKETRLPLTHPTFYEQALRDHPVSR